MNEDKVLKLLRIAVHSAYLAALCESTRDRKHFEFFKAISSGHLVMELSSSFADQFDKIRFGYLISVGYEFTHSDEQWETIKQEWQDDPRPKEKVFHIKSLFSGEDVRWTNAEFIRVPENIGDISL